MLKFIKKICKKVSLFTFKMLFKLATRSIPVGLTLSILVMFSVYGPSMFRNAIYMFTYKDILRIETNVGSYGSGFTVQGGSGEKYVITNYHVCTDGDGNKLQVRLIEYNSQAINTEILALHPVKDLCIIKHYGFTKPFKLSTFIPWRTPVFAIGYPSGMPLNMSHGEPLMEKPINSIRNDSYDTCISNGGNMIHVDIARHFITGVPTHRKYVCSYRPYYGFQTSVSVRQGSSGGPVLDALGNVIGVVTLKEQGHWGIAIYAKDVIDFVNSYEQNLK